MEKSILPAGPAGLVTREDLERSLREAAQASGSEEAGIYGPGSAGWQVNREAAVLVGGGCAALLQLAHPYVAAAIRDHSRTRDDVARRFARTFSQIFAMVFGTRAQAFAAARKVHRIHERIVGEVGERVGHCVESTRYHANDLDGLTWVHATLVHSAVRAVEFARGDLGAVARDRYVEDSHKLGRLFGIPRDRLPATFAGLERWIAVRIGDGSITPSRAAKSMAAFLLPAPRPRRPLVSAMRLITSGLLPEPLRDAYGLHFGAAERAGYLAARLALRSLYVALPRDLRFLPAYTAADRRLSARGPSVLAERLDRLIQLAASRW